MGLKQRIKNIFLKCDLFSTSQFLRYEDEPVYRTLTGSICSLIIVISFCALFMNVMINTFAKNEILWSMDIVDQSIGLYNVKTVTNNSTKNFMFAVAIGQINSKFNLNGPVKYFDVLFTLTSNNPTLIPNKIIHLQPCTQDHWNVSNEMLNTYRRMNFTNFLCPPIGLQIPIQGKYSSDIFRYGQIRINKCVPDNTSKICVNQTDVNNKTFFFNTFILNTIISPQSPESITYYLEDRNYVQFTTTFGGLLNIFISKYQIETDQSIWPLKSTLYEEGAIINDLGQPIPSLGDGFTYATVVFRRASTAIKVGRSFKKVDQTLSYIGGLFGFVMGISLIMNQYTEYSYEIDAGSHLYHETEAKPIESDNFNFLVFIGYLFYLFLDFINCKPNWVKMQAYDNCRQEIQKQFDVKLLFKRISFLERAASLLFNEDQYKMLHLHKKLTLKEAQQNRQHYLTYEKLKKSKDSIKLTESKINPQPERFNEQSNIVSSLDEIYNNLNCTSQSSQSLREQYKSTMKMLKKESLNGDELSNKIISVMDNDIVKLINQQSSKQSIASIEMEQKGKQDLQSIGRKVSQGQQDQNTQQLKENIIYQQKDEDSHNS